MWVVSVSADSSQPVDTKRAAGRSSCSQDPNPSLCATTPVAPFPHTHTHLLPRVAARLCSPVVDVHQRAVEVQLVLSSRIIPRKTLRELGRDLNSSYVLPRALNVLAMCLQNGLQMQCCCESRERRGDGAGVSVIMRPSTGGRCCCYVHQCRSRAIQLRHCSL